MNAKIKAAFAVACTALCALSLSACENTGKSTLLGKAATPTSLGYYERTDSYHEFTETVDEFASAFAAYAYEGYGKDENFAVSPLSVYMALSLAAECASGDTRDEVLNALGVTYEQLKENFPLLYRSVAVEYFRGNKTTSLVVPTNSIWVNDGTPVNQPCIDALSDSYYCNSYSADFYNDNANANQAIRHFIKEQTRGLIDNDFQITQDTLFTLINTLYLKTIWNKDGKDLPFTAQSYGFENADGSVKQTTLLQGYYSEGRVVEGETFSTFFTSTYNGYKIKFIVPKDGYGVRDVFTAENISAVNGIADYDAFDHENRLHYYTRCLFPEYECNYNEQINGLLNEKFGIDRLFNDPYYYPQNGCELYTLTTEDCYCDKVQHITELKVNRKGVEGAAVTVLEFPGAGAPAPDEYEEVYTEFVIDRAFGFIITDSYGTALFSGVVQGV